MIYKDVYDKMTTVTITSRTNGWVFPTREGGGTPPGKILSQFTLSSIRKQLIPLYKGSFSD